MTYISEGVVMLSALLGACHWAGPIFVEYICVRHDVGAGNNVKNLQTLPQKRS